jgi:hypothetical protein
MKTTKESDNRNGTHIRRGIVLFLTSCFFLGVIALAIHHHDVFFQLKGCGICKAKTSISNTFSKVKADLPSIMATVNHFSGEIYFTVTRIIFCHQAPFISSLLPNPFLNKAPPFIS